MEVKANTRQENFNLDIASLSTTTTLGIVLAILTKRRRISKFTLGKLSLSLAAARILDS